jgi:ABC-type multidrug transport system fused ATPase/permease subunit
MLATVARHHGRSTAPLLGWFASWNPWTWTNESFLVGLFLIAGLLVLARGILLNVGTMLASSAALTATTRVRRAVYAHSLRLGALATQPEAQLEAGDALTRRAEQLLDGCVVRLTAALQAPVLAVSCTLVLFAVKFWLGLAMVLLVGAVWLLAGQSAAWFRRDARLALRRTEARLGVLRENMTMMRLIKSYLMERFNQTRVERHLRDLAVAAERRLRGETIARPTLFTIVTLTGIILTFVAARVVLGGGLTPAGLLVQLMALAGLAYSIQRWIAASVRINRSREAVEALAEFLDRRPDAAQPIDAEFLQPLTRKLELNEVSYREAGTGRMIFDGLTLSIPVGERVAIICTESESQSLANLLTRFIDPTGGEVRLDGKNSRWMTFESVRTQIATVLQDSLTFSDTVATNIGCGEASFTLPQMIEAAKLAHAHQFVQRLPYGYETPLGDHGHSLRPGERFRIALARAVLRDPSVLVIEEPNEPYDPDSVALIEDALARFQPGRTIIILARRLNRTKSLDRVFVLHHGKLAASGSPDQVHGGSEVHKVLSTTRPGT